MLCYGTVYTVCKVCVCMCVYVCMLFLCSVSRVYSCVRDYICICIRICICVRLCFRGTVPFCVLFALLLSLFSYWENVKGNVWKDLLFISRKTRTVNKLRFSFFLFRFFANFNGRIRFKLDLIKFHIFTLNWFLVWRFFLFFFSFGFCFNSPCGFRFRVSAHRSWQIGTEKV